MTYAIEIHPPATAPVEALPNHAAKLALEVFALLELAPWSTGTAGDRLADAPVRSIAFGTYGMITYLILKDQRIVDILDVQWIDLPGTAG